MRDPVTRELYSHFSLNNLLAERLLRLATCSSVQEISFLSLCESQVSPLSVFVSFPQSISIHYIKHLQSCKTAYFVYKRDIVWYLLKNTYSMNITYNMNINSTNILTVSKLQRVRMLIVSKGK